MYQYQYVYLNNWAFGMTFNCKFFASWTETVYRAFDFKMLLSAINIKRFHEILYLFHLLHITTIEIVLCIELIYTLIFQSHNRSFCQGIRLQMSLSQSSDPHVERILRTRITNSQPLSVVVDYKTIK